ncbi:8-oxo-dGTP diphosphatase [Salirhabdus sp. Marseille-P4669]|uniref:8-oxo-dGTP diphosphatase n=1 Tax=Salirhabdus sp. Marseille-P4669 TaxID=2042310 RepID=UPI000C7E4F08|nr:8-oxo-dGTP diphosphatase [Salirhabdus sp. Marseille-P4669]
MQRVANCVLQNGNNVLMLKKPRRNWYVAPGGKMESGETIKQSAIREFQEETGLTVEDPKLKGVFTFLIYENEEIVMEWMMFTFYSKEHKGTLLEESKEGELEWVPVNEVLSKPMAEGDRAIIKHALQSDEILYGTFTYTSDYKLLSYQLDPQIDE